MPFHRAWYDHKTGQSPNSPREQVKYPIQREKATTSLFLFFFHHHQRLVETLTGTLAKKKREDRVKQTFARLNSLNGRLTVLSACRSDEKRDIIIIVVMESRPNPNVSSHLCSAEILLEIVSAFLHLIISYAEKRVGMAVCHLFKYGGSSCPSPPSCWWGRLESSSSFPSFFLYLYSTVNAIVSLSLSLVNALRYMPCPSL